MTSLAKSLDLFDLVGFGVASILGSGGFNLIGDALRAGGAQFPLALGGVSLLFQGASKAQETAFQAFPKNTAESDLIESQFGRIASNFSATSILLFNILSVSVILVQTAKMVFPHGMWSGQVGCALTLLAVMSLFSLQGIDLNKHLISLVAQAIVALLAMTGVIGGFEAFQKGIPKTVPLPASPPNLMQSILLFQFILAGFDALIKFTEEAKHPAQEIPRSFYLSNGLSSLLIVAVCFAFVMVIGHTKIKQGPNVVADVFQQFLGGSSGVVIEWVSISLMVITTFVCFLATTRQLQGLGDQVKELQGMRVLNEKKVPFHAVQVTAAVAAAGILVNHVDQLVRISDFFLTISMAILSAAAAKMRWNAGEVPWIEGLTAATFTGLLSMCCV